MLGDVGHALRSPAHRKGSQPKEESCVTRGVRSREFRMAEPKEPAHRMGQPFRRASEIADSRGSEVASS